MWFSLAKKSRQTKSVHSPRAKFRPEVNQLDERSLPSANPLDPTFGSGGLALGPSVGTGSITTSVIAQPDGKIVVGGMVESGVGVTGAFLLERFNSDGSFDTTFGAGGIVQTRMGNGPSGIMSMALQPDGKIVAVGNAGLTQKGKNYTTFAVVRYNANGSLDTSFGSGGITLTAIGPGNNGIDYFPSTFQDCANSVIVDSSGAIIVSGTANPNNGSLNDNRVAVARYKSNGKLDASFGSGGIVFGPQIGGQPTNATSLAKTPSGNIVVGASVSSTSNVSINSGGISLFQFTSSGKLDTPFGTNGVVSGVVPAGATTSFVNSLLIQSNGNILAAASSKFATNQQTLVSFTSTGAIDTSFGNQGFVVNADALGGKVLAKAANGDILVSGTAKNPADNTNIFCAAAYLPNGSRDVTYGTNGLATAGISGRNVGGMAMSLQADGKIVVAGTASNTPALARFLPPKAKIGSFTATPNPVPSGASVTLTASNILNSNPLSPIVSVAFYLDDGDDILDPSVDVLLGNATQTNPGVWSLTSTTGFGLPPGTYALFALATDSNGVLSDPLAVVLTVL
jgi:uncharacterized delta-60 repeat protein